MMKKVHLLAVARLFVATSLLAIAACHGGEQTETTDGSAKFAPLDDPNLQLLVTPSPAGHQPFIDAIDSARTSVRMVMYHLTDANVIQALINAHRRNVSVKLILDQSSLVDPSAELNGYNQLQAAGVDVMKSSTGFSITHEKAMAIDDRKVFITAMNMTNGYAAERDFGVITEDPAILAEWNAVFLADVENSRQTIWPSAKDPNPPAGPSHTPKLEVPSLIWSPVSSVTKLPALIGTARSSIVATVENINDTDVINAFGDAAQRGVDVRLITPQCVLGNALLDYPALDQLASRGVSTRIMQNLQTARNPYMHSKMILVDNAVAYVGSINFTGNSMEKAREAGIIFINSKATQTIRTEFDADWSNSIAVPKPVPANYCQ